MNTQTIMPDVPDCGAPCAICEAHAHAASRLQAIADRQAAEIVQMTARIMKMRCALIDMQFAGHVGYVRALAQKTLEETQ